MGITVLNDSNQEVMTIDQTGIHIKKGEIAWTSDNAPVKYQFGASLSGPWHDTMEDGDKYRRDSLNGGVTYGEPYQFKGTDGRNGSDANVTFANIKAALQKAASTQTTFITADEMGAPNIYGGNIYGANIYAGDGKGMVASMMGEGFYIHDQNISAPKLSMESVADGDIVRIVLGAGSRGDGSGASRAYITKNTEGLGIRYYDVNKVPCGFDFLKNGIIQVRGTLQGVNAVWAD